MKFLQKLKTLSRTEADLSGLQRWLARKTFRFRRTDFLEALAGMVRDGTPVMRALAFIRDVESDFGKKKSHSARWLLAGECMESIRRTGMMSPALNDWLPQEEVSIIRPGEERGELAEALFQVVRTVRARSEMMNDLARAGVYPVLLLALCVVNMYNAHTRIIPLVSAFAGEDKWPLQMKILAAVSGFVVGYGPWLLVALVAATVLTGFSFTRYNGPGRQLLDRLPPWSLWRTFQGVNYLFSIASMLSINMPVSQALARAGRSAAGNPWLQVRIEAIRRQVLAGQSLALAMKNSGYDFPSGECVNNLLLNSEREDSVSLMAVYADRWLDEARKNVRKTGAVMTGIAGLLAFGFILNMTGAIWGISSMLQS